MRNANVEGVVEYGEEVFPCAVESIGLHISGSVSIEDLKIEFLFDEIDAFRQIFPWRDILLFNSCRDKSLVTESSGAKGMVSKMLLLIPGETKVDADISMHLDESQFATRAVAYSRLTPCPGC
ncbi:hypothetical protein [Burkholderia alba]|uniref:hypothetical protein n=1 Tax=Burkholderia alba TaxID=2683677 RepID=UPI002B060FC8|nr:hypothetical protein [Burkholderia alba]